MNVSPLSSNRSVHAAALAATLGQNGMPTAAQLAADRKTLESSGKPGQPSQADVKKAASQFEAIILRQLLEPSLTPLMSGGLGGGEGTGGGMYAYMLTDVVANSLAQGGGLGWARMLEKQLSPSTGKADINSQHATNT
jgi:peptidoglycan hydrolase FlgJ